MIYEYLKKKLNYRNPNKCFETLRSAEADIAILRKEIESSWTYCCGCRDYVMRADAYEGYTDNNRPVLRCGRCDSIWRFLD
jgi:hypothetical protein